MRLQKFALSARLEAAREEAAKNPWWAWSVWLLGHVAQQLQFLVVLEVASLPFIVHISILTSPWLAALPLALLLQAPQPFRPFAQPLCLQWPVDHSRLGFLRLQRPATLFSAAIIVFQL
ncbi:unnamed protein product [Symbiodinium natans]|uniref:Uncharacterized protein n=1 Tax=Symbiodinium natans TaxID=878477 RepID=A0A812S8Z8_9DINO|nr:unnamed protein product [Symbiodinium natans]